VVAFARISPFHLSVPCVVFGEAHPDTPVFQFDVVACEKGPLSTTAGFSITAPMGLAALRHAHTIIVPSWRDPTEPAPAALLRALCAAHARGATVVGLCLGAFVLAQAGLLNGRRATTHWAYADVFAAQFPQINLDRKVLYVDDGSILTSAGTAAGIDCCLHLLRRQYGSAVANRVARRLVIAPHRQGGQAQFIAQPLPTTTRSSNLSNLLEWLRAHLQEPHTLDSLAQRCAMGRRTFSRQFKQATAYSLVQWLVRERLAYCQRLLESTDQSLENIAALVGFGSAQSLRQHFKAAYGISAQDWKKSFRQTSAADCGPPPPTQSTPPPPTNRLHPPLRLQPQ
jgi:transcriptional regulator GlxA family with amidase domain